MATAQELVTRAYRRLQAIDIYSEASDAEMTHGLTCLSELINGWAMPLPELAVRTLPATVVSGDATLVFQDTALIMPGLNVSGNGIPADAYVLSVTNGADIEISANATASAEDVDVTFTPIPFPVKHEGGVIALLAVRLAEDLGVPVLPQIQKDADAGWYALLGSYTKDTKTEFDRGLVRTGNSAGGNFMDLS